MESGDTTSRGGRQTRQQMILEQKRAKRRLVVGYITVFGALVFLSMMFGYVVLSAMLKE